MHGEAWTTPYEKCLIYIIIPPKYYTNSFIAQTH